MSNLKQYSSIADLTKAGQASVAKFIDEGGHVVIRMKYKEDGEVRLVTVKLKKVDLE